jgi:hypothetical protein
MTDRETWYQFARFQAMQERKYGKLFYQLVRRQAVAFARYIRDHGIELAEANINLIVRKEDTASLLRRLYREVGVRWANVEYGNIQDEIKASAGPAQGKAFGYNEEWEAILNIFFEAQGGLKITSIDDTTKEWLIRKITEGRAAGLGPEQIVRSMVTDKEIPLMRARVISRTETVAAANFGGITAARKTGLKMNKRWVNAKDKRVRELHKDQAQGGVGGEIVPLDQPFSNGLMHPGDPNGSAKQVIQCRCIASMRPVRDAAGMPVRL